MFALLLALVLAGVTACSKWEATGVLESVEMKAASGKIAYTLSFALDGGGHIVLQGKDAQDAADVIGGSNNIPGTLNSNGQPYRVKLHRSWSGEWRVKEVLAPGQK
jgi:hypothetical protein